MRGVGAVLLLLAPSVVLAQLQPSMVSGRLFGPQGSAVRGAEVILLDTLGQRIDSAVSDTEGRFRIRSVPPGTYYLRAAARALRSASHRLVIADGLPLAIDLVLTAQLSETVNVAPGTSGRGGAAGTTLAGTAVQRTASPLRAAALRAAVAGTPGWTAEDNGLLHHRGVDDGLLFVLDGIPVYERLDPQFAAGLDPLTLGSVRVLSGYVPAEYGLRSGGVVEVRSASPSVHGWSGVVESGIGDYDGRALATAARGPLGRNARLAAAFGGERSRRFLDPVSPDNLHNQGSTGSGDAALTWAPSTGAITLRAGHARSSFQVPHTAEQEEAAQDQRQRLRQSFATFDWQRAWSGVTVSHLAVFARANQGRLRGSPADTPLFADSVREQGRQGFLAATAHERGRHRWKVGVEASRIHLDERFQFFVTDAEAAGADLSDAARQHDADHPFEFAGTVSRPVFSVYVQDSWRASNRVAIDLGFRYDRTRLLLAESQWSPRLGVSYRAGAATFRASVNRFFQPPQTEHLLLSSSSLARRLSPFAAGGGAGGAEIRSERQTSAEAGCEWWIRDLLRVDAALWGRWIRNQGDPNVFLGTTIVFPNSVDRGRARGLDLRVELPHRAGLSASVTYTLAAVEQFGPINGGLFLEDDAIDIGPGTRFTPDHDQRHSLSAEATYDDDERGFWVGASGRYRTGPPLEVADAELAELRERPGADLVDFARGRVKPYATVDVQAGRRLIRRQRFDLSARAAVLNLTDTRYAFNFGNPFSGTHFGAARGFRFDLRLQGR